MTLRSEQRNGYFSNRASALGNQKRAGPQQSASILHPSPIGGIEQQTLSGPYGAANEDTTSFDAQRLNWKKMTGLSTVALVAILVDV
jgi:hypothetical protein